MQRLIIDTNVLVSSILSKSYPYLIVRTILLEKKEILCISEEIFNEYEHVLTRSKFSKYPRFEIEAEMLLAFIDAFAVKYTPTVKVKIIRDHSDNKFLELAATCKANFLITGNTNDFSMSSFEKTKIVAPKEYWEKYRINTGK